MYYLKDLFISFLQLEEEKRFEHQSEANENTFRMPDQLSSPCSYFTRFFDEELFQLIAEQTNLYSCQLRGTSINTNPDEVRSFMKLVMGIVKMPISG